MTKIIIYGDADDVRYEDGGMAAILNVYNSDEDSPLFLRLQSWDDKGWDDTPNHESHTLLQQFENKPLKITIEVIEE